MGTLTVFAREAGGLYFVFYGAAAADFESFAAKARDIADTGTIVTDRNEQGNAVELDNSCLIG